MAKSGAKFDVAAKLQQLTDLVNQRFDQLEGQVNAMPLLPTREPSASEQPQNSAFEPRERSESAVPDAAWQTRLTRIEQQVQQLTQQVQQLTRQEQQLERRVQQLERRSFSSDSGVLAPEETTLEDEEIEDEPDEILLEFLEPGERT